VTRRAIFATLALPLALVALAGCRKEDAAPPVRAEFGVFFGGQVQERDAIELPRGASGLVHGIRLDFADPPKRALAVTWEIEKPDPASKSGDGKLVEYGKVSSRAGEPRLDIPLAFKRGDRAGKWHVKASVEGVVVLDRQFEVLPPTTKPRTDEED
jgi:hypothetical protein